MDTKKVSVLIASYNRKDWLKLALLSYNHQFYKDFEVIVACDGATDGTFEMVKNLKKDLTYPIKFVYHKENLGFRKCLILDKAALVSNSDYLIFADDDMVVPPKYIGSHMAKINDKNVVLGKYIPISSDNPLFTEQNITSGKFSSYFPIKFFFRLLYWKMKYRQQILFKHPTRPKLVGNNFSISKNAFVSVNGLDCDFITWGYEDDDIRNRLLKSGITLAEVVLSGYSYNFGWKKSTQKSFNSEHVSKNKTMAYSKSRPFFCKNGLKEILSKGIPNTNDWVIEWN